MYVFLTPPPLPGVVIGLVNSPLQCVPAYTLSENVYSSIDIDQNVDCPIFQEETML